MRYQIEDLTVPITIKYKQFEYESLAVLVNCTIEITDWTHNPAIRGVPYNGGENLPEPSEPESWEATKWAIDPETIVVFFGETEVTWAGQADEEKKVALHKMVNSMVAQHADWALIDERLTEYMGG